MSFRARHAAHVLAALGAIAVSSAGATRARVFRGVHEREVLLRSDRRGIFFGSGGPATKSLRWEFSFTLHGDGPVYAAHAIEMKDGGLKPVAVRSGSIVLSDRSLRIDLRIGRNGRPAPFPYNGTYRLRR